MKKSTNNQSNRFVVLFHEFPPGHRGSNHWDLMLEQNGKLLTWALSQLPAVGKSIPAQRLPDHRLDYLNYEGPISDNRGKVSRVMAGTYSWQPGAELTIAQMALKTCQWEIRIEEFDQTNVTITILAA